MTAIPGPWPDGYGSGLSVAFPVLGSLKCEEGDLNPAMPPGALGILQRAVARKGRERHPLFPPGNKREPS